jgi:hypothetical protein
MDYKIFYRRVVFVVLVSFIAITYQGCGEKDKIDISNTFFVELVNFNDSVRNQVINSIVGKVSYFKNNKLQVVSLNYIDERYPDMHYFKNINDQEANQVGARKIRVELRGDYSADSTSYSIQRFKYENDAWVKISDMGFIKATVDTRKKAFAESLKEDELPVRQLVNQVVNNIVLSTY